MLKEYSLIDMTLIVHILIFENLPDMNVHDLYGNVLVDSSNFWGDISSFTLYF